MSVMRKILVCMLIVSIVLTLIFISCSHKRVDATKETYYALSAEVTTINTVRGYVGFTDNHHREWYWYDGLHDVPWKIGEDVLLVMSNSGTDYIFDDQLVSITFEGVIDYTVSK